MQLVNTPNLNAISPALLSASTAPVSKNDLDTVLSVADKPMHSEMTAISELASDFVLLAETTLALVGSDQKREPEIDEKEVSDLGRLKQLKADTEQTLKGSAAHLDFSEGAMEMKLTMLSIELSETIDKLLKGRMQSQKDRNAQIEALNDLLSELRKKEKSTEKFTAEDLDKVYLVLPPNSPVQRQSAERIREREIAAVLAEDVAGCHEVEEFERSMLGVGDFIRVYKVMIAHVTIDSVSSADGGGICYTGHEISTGKEFTKTIGAYGSFFYPTWAADRMRSIYAKKQDALAKIDKEYAVNVSSEKASLNDLLIGYGVYKVGEKLPATKEDLEAATEKISSMINSINSTQSMKMLDIHKFTNGRNEAYDLAVKVNNTKFDSLNALIRMVGDR